jgi:hypothetical protein
MQPMGGPPMGAPQPGFGGPAPGGFPPPQQPQYPPAGGFGVAPQQDLPGPLDNMARGLPSSAPGTILGFPVSRLRDPAIQKKVLFLCGAGLLIAAVLPFSFSPFAGSWSMSPFHFLVWPLLAGAAYVFVAAAPAEMQQKMPPALLQWLPFSVSFIGVSILGTQGGGAAAFGVMGYATLVFGLLSRIAQPNDQVARIIIAVGSVMMIWPWAMSLGVVFGFHGNIINILSNLIGFLVNTLGVLCVLFVVPPQKLPPALQSVDAFGPLVCALLIIWIPAQYVLGLLNAIIFGINPFLPAMSAAEAEALAEAVKLAAASGVDVPAGLGGGRIAAILFTAHYLMYYVAYFGVLMMTAPAAYEESKRMFANKGGGGGPPQGGGYPPQGGGGYPPQGGGGYPPQGGGGYPPQGGGFPPPAGGGGYPPQGGGGYPPPGGGYPPA